MILDYRLQAIANQLIALSYYAIPLGLAISAHARHHILKRGLRDPGNVVLILFGLFILACGTSHQIDAIALWNIECSANTSAKRYSIWVTAALSVFTAVVLFPRLPGYIMLLFKPFDFQRLQAETEELRRKVADFERQQSGKLDA